MGMYAGAGDRVAVLGLRVADRLSITRVDNQPSIFIDGTAYAVIGILGETQTRAELRDGILIHAGPRAAISRWRARRRRSRRSRTAPDRRSPSRRRSRSRATIRIR